MKLKFVVVDRLDKAAEFDSFEEALNYPYAGCVEFRWAHVPITAEGLFSVLANYDDYTVAYSYSEDMPYFKLVVKKGE